MRKNTHTILVLIGLIVMVVGAFQFDSPNMVQASLESLVPDMQSTEEPVDENEVTREAEISAIPEDNSPYLYFENYLENKIDDPGQLVEVVTELINIKEDKIRQPGWVHVSVREYQPPDGQEHSYAGVDVSDMFAGVTIHDTWMHISDEGLILDAFVTIKDEAGNELQKVLSTEHGNSGNITLIRKGLDKGIPASDHTKKTFDLIQATDERRVLSYLQWSQDRTANISGWYEKRDERDVFVVFIEFSFEPVEMPNQSQLVIASTVEYVFDAQTGDMVSTVTQQQLEDGSWVVCWSSTKSLEIMPDLPGEIQDEFSRATNELDALMGGE